MVLLLIRITSAHRPTNSASVPRTATANRDLRPRRSDARSDHASTRFNRGTGLDDKLEDDANIRQPLLEPVVEVIAVGIDIAMPNCLVSLLSGSSLATR